MVVHEPPKLFRKILADVAQRVVEAEILKLRIAFLSVFDILANLGIFAFRRNTPNVFRRRTGRFGSNFLHILSHNRFEDVGNGRRGIDGDVAMMVVKIDGTEIVDCRVHDIFE